jgi:hypothetical protein
MFVGRFLWCVLISDWRCCWVMEPVTKWVSLIPWQRRLVDQCCRTVWCRCTLLCAFSIKLCSDWSIRTPMLSSCSACLKKMIPLRGCIIRYSKASSSPNPAYMVAVHFVLLGRHRNVYNSENSLTHDGWHLEEGGLDVRESSWRSCDESVSLPLLICRTDVKQADTSFWWRIVSQSASHRWCSSLVIADEDGDKICLFGFSRGAYTARALAGM